MYQERGLYEVGTYQEELQIPLTPPRPIVYRDSDTSTPGLTFNMTQALSDNEVTPVRSYPTSSLRSYTGIQNQGATCYLNSLLQTLFFLKKFRVLVNQLQPHGDPSRDVPLNFQRLFAALELGGCQYVNTKELCESFGWNSNESFVQHDVEELLRILLEKMTSYYCKQNVGVVEGDDPFSKLFSGEMRNYVRVIEVNFCSERKDTFKDIQLLVENQSSIRESMLTYVKPDLLDGNNQYRVENEDGTSSKHDATKGVFLTKMPPVLVLHLRRFTFSMETLSSVKLSNRVVFEETLDASPLICPDCTEEIADSQYTLMSVMVHTGDLTGGHYFVFIRPEADGLWWMFNDKVVSQVPPEEAIDANFGGFSSNNRCAYMLTYVKTSRFAEIMCCETILPPHLAEFMGEEMKRQQLQSAQIDKDKREMQLTLLTTDTMRMCESDEFQASHGVAHYIRGPVIRVSRKANTFDIYDAVAKHFHMKQDEFRIWVKSSGYHLTKWFYLKAAHKWGLYDEALAPFRRDHPSYHPSYELEMEESLPVDIDEYVHHKQYHALFSEAVTEGLSGKQLCDVQKMFDSEKPPTFYLYIETRRGQEPWESFDDGHLCFVKYFKREEQRITITFAGAFVVNGYHLCREKVISECRKLIGVADDADVTVFEDEPSHDDLLPILDVPHIYNYKECPFLVQEGIITRDAALKDRWDPSLADVFDTLLPTTAPGYYWRSKNRSDISFLPLDMGIEFKPVVYLTMKYEHIQTALAKTIEKVTGIQSVPGSLRLYRHNDNNGGPMSHPEPVTEYKTLKDMVQSTSGEVSWINSTLYFDEISVNYKELCNIHSYTFLYTNREHVYHCELRTNRRILDVELRREIAEYLGVALETLMFLKYWPPISACHDFELAYESFDMSGSAKLYVVHNESFVHEESSPVLYSPKETWDLNDDKMYIKECDYDKDDPKMVGVKPPKYYHIPVLCIPFTYTDMNPSRDWRRLFKISRGGREPADSLTPQYLVDTFYSAEFSVINCPQFTTRRTPASFSLQYMRSSAFRKRFARVCRRECQIFDCFDDDYIDTAVNETAWEYLFDLHERERSELLEHNSGWLKSHFRDFIHNLYADAPHVSKHLQQLWNNASEIHSPEMWKSHYPTVIELDPHESFDQFANRATEALTTINAAGKVNLSNVRLNPSIYDDENRLDDTIPTIGQCFFFGSRSGVPDDFTAMDWNVRPYTVISELPVFMSPCAHLLCGVVIGEQHSTLLYFKSNVVYPEPEVVRWRRELDQQGKSKALKKDARIEQPLRIFN